MLNKIFLVLVLLMITPNETFSRTISSRNYETGQHEELQNHHSIEARDSSRILTNLQPFYVSNSNTVYGSYSSKVLKLDTKSDKFKFGPKSFYQQDLYSYIKDGITPKSGIFGFAAHFDTINSDYTFFKSISNNKLQTRDISFDNKNNNNNKQSIELISDSKDSFMKQKRDEDRVQCKNQSGDSMFFSRNECLSAANKMTFEKTAMSSCGGCQLIMIGPQGELSSSNIPVDELQVHASNILSGCVTGRRVEFFVLSFT